MNADDIVGFLIVVAIGCIIVMLFLTIIMAGIASILEIILIPLRWGAKIIAWGNPHLKTPEKKYRLIEKVWYVGPIPFVDVIRVPIEDDDDDVDDNSKPPQEETRIPLEDIGRPSAHKARDAVL